MLESTFFASPRNSGAEQSVGGVSWKEVGEDQVEDGTFELVGRILDQTQRVSVISKNIAY